MQIFVINAHKKNAFAAHSAILSFRVNANMDIAFFSHQQTKVTLDVKLDVRLALQTSTIKMDFKCFAIQLWLDILSMA